MCLIQLFKIVEKIKNAYKNEEFDMRLQFLVTTILVIVFLQGICKLRNKLT